MASSSSKRRRARHVGATGPKHAVASSREPPDCARSRLGSAGAPSTGGALASMPMGLSALRAARS